LVLRQPLWTDYATKQFPLVLKNWTWLKHGKTPTHVQS
jgi:hypothetical protein